MNRRLSTQDVSKPSCSSLSGPSHRRACRNKPQARASAVHPRWPEDRWLLRSPRRKLHGRRRSSASRARRYPQRLSRFRCTACACRSAARVRWTRRISNAFDGSSNATSPRWSPSISPGRRTRRPISTTCCLCPIPRRRLRPCAITSTRSRKPSAEGCCSKIRRPMSRFANRP